MPELPEVETVRRGLEPAMLGARIASVEARRADIRFALPAHFRQRLEGKRVVTLGRRAKYLLFGLDSGETLIAHLGMSGSFRIENAGVGEFHHPRSKDAKHDHVVFSLDSGMTITYNDPRRFGFMDLEATATLDASRHLKGLGDEPLAQDFDAARLATLFAGSRAPMKVALLDQRRIAGLGNIYACEALWRARLRPSNKAGTLADTRGRPTSAAKKLAPAVKAVLEEAIGAGGSTLRDHRQADGNLGYFQHALAVYGREDQPCLRPKCKGVIRRTIHAGRSTFWCPVCQK
jgi:formamidopyrimidine-DNA glycosylase